MEYSFNRKQMATDMGWTQSYTNTVKMLIDYFQFSRVGNKIQATIVFVSLNL